MTTKCYDYHSGAQSLFEGFAFHFHFIIAFPDREASVCLGQRVV